MTVSDATEAIRLLERAGARQLKSDEWYEQIDAVWRSDRQQNRGRADQLARGHREFFTAAYADLVREGMRMRPRVLLDALATEFGLAWVDLSRMVHVSVPAIRKWRLAGGVSPENLQRLAEVWALLTSLQQRAGVDDPAAWISRRMEPGYAVAPKHIWSREHAGLLIDFASGGVKAPDVLDAIDPTWREKYETADDVVVFEDGLPAVVRR